jgi:hypothetical protein
MNKCSQQEYIVVLFIVAVYSNSLVIFRLKLSPKKKRVFYICIYSLIEISVIKTFQIHVAVSCISIKMFTKADKSDLLFVESDCGVLLEVTCLIVLLSVLLEVTWIS